jgi:transposase-like protein
VDSTEHICNEYIAGASCSFLSHKYGLGRKILDKIFSQNGIRRNMSTEKLAKAHKIKTLYESGLGVMEISRRLSFSKSTVIAGLKQLGIHRPSHHDINAAKLIKLQQVYKLHNSGLSNRHISRELGIARSLVTRYLSESGIPSQKINQYLVNKYYFDVIDSSAKAYWLGFILADGHIQKFKENTYALRVRLQSGDLNHLKKFAADIQYDGPVEIKHRYDKFYKAVTSKAVMVICSTHLCKSLVNNGWFEFKNYGDLRVLNTVPDDLSHYLIRGLFDGDGGLSLVAIKGCNKTQASFSYVDMHKSVVEWVQSWLIKNVKAGAVRIRKMKANAYVFLNRGNLQVKRILDHLYSGDDEPKLIRKYEKYLQIGKESRYARAA